MPIDPVVLFFLLGLIARLSRSDLRLPEALYETLSVYLLLAIGLKGGAELARQPLGSVLPVALTGVALSALLPLLAYPGCVVWGGWRRSMPRRSLRTTARSRWSPSRWPRVCSRARVWPWRRRCRCWSR